MGRTGISYFDVSNAIASIQGRQKNPTVDAIREELGTGSRSTIAKYFHEWKTKNDLKNTTTSGVPNELQNLIESLWEKIQSDADEKINAHQKEAEASISHAQSELVATQHQNTQLQSEIETLSEKLNLQVTTNETLKTELADEKMRAARLLERIHSLESQNSTHQADIERLHQLLKNTQDNLVHFQKAIEQQRHEQLTIQEKQRNEHETKINQLQNQTLILSQEKAALESKNRQHEALHATLEHDYKTIQSTHNHLQNEQRELLMRFNQLQESYQRAENEIENKALEINLKNDEITDFKIKQATCENQLIYIQQSLSEFKAQYENSLAEKIRLEHQLACIKENKEKILTEL